VGRRDVYIFLSSSKHFFPNVERRWIPQTFFWVTMVSKTSQKKHRAVMRLIFENRAKAGVNIAKSRWNLVIGKGLQSDSAGQVGEVDFYTAFDLFKHYFPNFERRARDLAHNSCSSFFF
jgi:hypothetical protein